MEVKMSNAAKTRYNERNYDQIHIWVRVGEKRTIEAAAKAAGESINRYCAGAITDKIRSTQKDVADLRLDKYEKVV